jgi:hypothetical protein
LHHVGEPTETPRVVIRVNVEDGMVPPNNWDERLIAAGEIIIDNENIERILGAKKP